LDKKERIIKRNGKRMNLLVTFAARNAGWLNITEW